MKVNGNHSCDWTCFSKYMSVIFKADDFSMIQQSFDNLNKAEITIDPNEKHEKRIYWTTNWNTFEELKVLKLNCDKNVS